MKRSFPKMPIKKYLLFSLFITSLYLASLTFGIGSTPASALQVEGTHTPTYTPSGEENPTEIPGTASPIPSNTPTSTETNVVPSEAILPSESGAPETGTKSLPAIFKAGAHVSNELIVRFKRTTSPARIEQCLQGVDVQITSEIEEIRTLVLDLKSGNLADAYGHVLSCAGVLYVEPNFLLQATDTFPNDPNWNLQYGLVNIRAPQGWDITTGSAAVTIAIVDSGVDQGHPEFAGKLVAGYDFVNNDANPQDDFGHGTHVAGIAAASSNNGAGVAGVSWGARIMPVKVLNATGGGTYANTAAGVIWAVDHGAQIINLSLGGTGPSSVMEDAINYAHGKSVVVVASAGNGGGNFVLYPARYPNVIAVAAADSSNNWSGSNYGPEVDLAAPGDMIYSTVIGGYGYRSGSSMAAAFTSGLAAILTGISGSTSPDTIEFQMESTALDIEFAGWDEYTGAGLIQMDAAIYLAIPPTKIPRESDASSAGSGNAPILIAPTNTPIPTWTASPTIIPQDITATVFSETDSEPNPSITETPTSTPTQAKDEPEVEAQSGINPGQYLLPCGGFLLVLVGLLLLWRARKKRQENSQIKLALS